MAKDKAKKTVTTEDLRAKSADELKKDVIDLKKQQFNLRFQKAGGQLANTAEVRAVRRQVARIKTIAAQKAASEKMGEATKGVKAPAKAKAAAKPAAKTKAKKTAE